MLKTKCIFEGIISACLAGYKSRYNCENKYEPILSYIVREGRLLPLCPEMVAGLGLPRKPIYLSQPSKIAIISRRYLIMNKDEDITSNFLTNLEALYEERLRYLPKLAILKEGSPSCGVHWYNDGNGLKSGRGLFAEFLYSRRFRLIGV
ncbi:MAG: DUF523 domain-containing protein [bacterium]